MPLTWIGGGGDSPILDERIGVSMSSSPMVYDHGVKRVIVGEYLQIIAPPAKARWDCVVISDAIIGVMNHWIDGRTTLHNEQTCFCEGRNAVIKWEGFLHVGLFNEKRDQYIVRFGDIAGTALTMHYEKHGTLRGCHGMFERKGQAKNGPLYFTVDAEKPILPVKTTPVNVLALVENMFTPRNVRLHRHDGVVYDLVSGAMG